MINKTLLSVMLCSALSYAQACTNIMVQAEDKSVLIARTMEFGPSLNSDIVTSPKGTTFNPANESDPTGMPWQGKYGFVYMNFFGQDHAVDGMNDQGLSIGFLYLPGFTKYPAKTDVDLDKAIPYYMLGDWALSQFKTTEEVKAALNNLQVFDNPITLEGKAYTFPLHLIVNDSQGKSIVVEFNDGKLQVYDNPLGILTNAPTFDWQLTNLKNYANLTPYAVEPIKIDGMTYSATGQGAGMVGLPGDSTPPSRFVKMAFLQKTALPVATAEKAVVLARHIITNVFIPDGMVRDEKGKPGTEITQWTVFKDLKNHKLYFKSYDYPALRMVDLNKVDLKEGSKVVRLPAANPAPLAQDVSDKLK